MNLYEFHLAGGVRAYVVASSLDAAVAAARTAYPAAGPGDARRLNHGTVPVILGE